MYTINWGPIFENLGLFGLIIGGVTWLLKSLGKDLIKRRFAAFEKELDIKSREYQVRLDADLYTHKTKLDIEHTQFQKLHEKRLEIIVELYITITELDRAMHIMTALIKPIPSGQDANTMEKEQVQAASDAYQKFQRFYLTNKIFLNPDTCKILDTLEDKYWNSFWDGTTHQRLGPTDLQYNYEQVKKASVIVKQHIPPLKDKLEVEFRKVLGVK